MTPPPYFNEIKEKWIKPGTRKLTPRGSQLIKQQIQEVLKGNYQRDEENRKKYCPEVVKVCP